MSTSNRPAETPARENPAVRESTPSGWRAGSSGRRNLDAPPARPPGSDPTNANTADSGALSFGNPGGNAVEGRKESSSREPLEKPDTLAEASIKILIAMSIYLTLIPLIIVIALKDTYYWYGLIFGLAFSGTLVAVNGALWGFSLKKVRISQSKISGSKRSTMHI